MSTGDIEKWSLLYLFSEVLEYLGKRYPIGMYFCRYLVNRCRLYRLNIRRSGLFRYYCYSARVVAVACSVGDSVHRPVSRPVDMVGVCSGVLGLLITEDPRIATERVSALTEFSEDSVGHGEGGNESPSHNRALNS